MYNRNWLRTEIAGYLHDDSVSANIDTWIDIGAKRVSQVLECWEMEVSIVNSLATIVGAGVIDGGNANGGGVIIDGGDAYNADPEGQALPYLPISGTTKRIIEVQVLRNSEWRNLRSVPKHEASRYKTDGGGTASVYRVENRKIYPLPFQPGDYRAIVLQEVQIPAGDNENDALTSYPFIFLNAALAEAYDWKQNAEMNGRYESKWIQEAEQIKLVYRGERGGETPSMRAM
jgi:hypothetical protein